MDIMDIFRDLVGGLFYDDEDEMDEESCYCKQVEDEIMTYDPVSMTYLCCDEFANIESDNSQSQQQILFLDAK